MTPHEKRITARIAARKSAEDVLELLDWPDGTGADFADAFLERMRSLLPRRQEKDPPPKTVPLARLAATTMPFGKHEGRRFDDIPDDYLDWLCRSQEEFLADLRAYLRHPDRTQG